MMKESGVQWVYDNSLNKQNDEAIASLQKSISLNPQNRLAINFYNQLSALTKKK